MDKKDQTKDFEKVEGAKLSDEEQEQVQGSLISELNAEADMVKERQVATTKATAGFSCGQFLE